MDEDYTRETQPGDENMQITNIVSKEQSRQENHKTTSFSQKQEKLMEKSHFQNMQKSPVFTHMDMFQSK